MELIHSLLPFSLTDPANSLLFKYTKFLSSSRLSSVLLSSQCVFFYSLNFLFSNNLLPCVSQFKKATHSVLSPYTPPFCFLHTYTLPQLGSLYSPFHLLIQSAPRALDYKLHGVRDHV